MITNYNKQHGLNAFSFAVIVYFVLQIIASPFALSFATGTVGYWLTLAFISILLGVSSLIFAKLNNCNFVACTKANGKFSVTEVILGCTATLGLMSINLPITEWIFDFLESLGLSRPTVELPMQLIPLLIVACVIPALCEEFVFRGTVGNGITYGNNKLAGCFAVGALFALFHMNPAQTLHQFLLGSWLMILVVTTNSIWPSVIAHLFNNLCAVGSGYVFTIGDVTDNAAIFILCGVVVTAVSVWLYFSKQVHRNNLVGTTVGDVSTCKVDKQSVAYFVVAVCCCLFVWVATLLE